jgi:hypothetical protein
MVPKTTKGQSFIGAGRYYLHDKRLPGESERYTTERVEFVHTHNLPTADGWKAIKWMAHTAMRQDELKRAAIARGEDISLKGRKSQYPVYAYSLSWHPEQEPSREEMIAAATASLEANDLDKGYEVLMVAHNDEPQPHIHVIVNRVHPENGIMAPLSNDHLKLSRWAEAYERDAGKIYCEQRVENNRRRREGAYVKDTRSVLMSDFYRWRAEQTKQGFERRESEAQTLSDTHKQQREDLYQWKENLIKNRRAELKDERKPLWADLYKKQAFEREMLRLEHESGWNKARYFTRHRDPDALNRRHIISEGFNELVSGQDQRKELTKRHEQERLAMAGFFKEQTKAEIKKINEGYRRRLDQLKKQQLKERQEQQRRHSRESQERAREITEGRDAERFDEQRQKETRWERKREGFREAGKDILGGQETSRRRSRRRKRTRDRKPPGDKS